MELFNYMILRRLKGLPGFNINRHSFNICCTDSEEKLKVLLDKIFREGKMAVNKRDNSKCEL